MVKITAVTDVDSVEGGARVCLLFQEGKKISRLILPKK